MEAKDFLADLSIHPDPDVDLACLNVTGIRDEEKQIFYRTINLELVCDFTEPNLLPGSEVLFLGYPENRFDTKNNLPILRRGYIGSMPKVDFEGRQQFLIDAQVFPGSSGSPVFTSLNGKMMLLGIVTETMVKHF